VKVCGNEVVRCEKKKQKLLAITVGFEIKCRIGSATGIWQSRGRSRTKKVVFAAGSADRENGSSIVPSFEFSCTKDRNRLSHKQSYLTKKSVGVEKRIQELSVLRNAIQCALGWLKVQLSSTGKRWSKVGTPR
jgi:hypothetical protein